MPNIHSISVSHRSFGLWNVNFFFNAQHFTEPKVTFIMSCLVWRSMTKRSKLIETWECVKLFYYFCMKNDWSDESIFKIVASTFLYFTSNTYLQNLDITSNYIRKNKFMCKSLHIFKYFMSNGSHKPIQRPQLFISMHRPGTFVHLIVLGCNYSYSCWGCGEKCNSVAVSCKAGWWKRMKAV